MRLHVTSVDQPSDTALGRAWPRHKPDDEPQDRKDQDKQDPKHLFPRGRSRSDHRNDRPEVENKDDKTADSGDFKHDDLLHFRYFGSAAQQRAGHCIARRFSHGEQPRPVIGSEVCRSSVL